MRRSTIVFLVAVPLFTGGCADTSRILDPQPMAVLSRAAGATHDVQLLDQCDPATFNAAIAPGTCLSTHPGVTFDRFLLQLTKQHDAAAWRNAPSNFTMPFGGTIVATNRGGEVHSFTQVAAFAGGVVPFLNQIVGLNTQAPECLAAPPSEFLPPGAQDVEPVTQHGTLYFECCIHPWMRTTVVVP